MSDDIDTYLTYVQNDLYECRIVFDPFIQKLGAAYKPNNQIARFWSMDNRYRIAFISPYHTHMLMAYDIEGNVCQLYFRIDENIASKLKQYSDMGYTIFIGNSCSANNIIVWPPYKPLEYVLIQLDLMFKN